MYRVALLSFHGCPLARLGERDTGGMNVYLLQLARELSRSGNHVDVYTRSHDPSDPQIIDIGDNSRVIHLRAGPYFETKESLYQYIPEFLKTLDLFQMSEGITYDLIHSHYWLSGYAAGELSRKWGVPHVTTFHTLARRKILARSDERVSQLRVLTETKVINSADAIVVSTDQEKEDLTVLYQASPNRVEVVPAGVDFDRFHPIDQRHSRIDLGLDDKNIVLAVGRIEPLKGLDTLVSAIALMRDRRNTRLLVVGGGSDCEIDRLETYAATLGVGESVSFVGSIDQSELPTYYSAADVFVMPSYYESFGLVALEAMACGVPVIASKIVGPSTFMTEGETGFLIPSRSSRDYADRLDFLMANWILRESMGRASRLKAITMGWDRVANTVLGLYMSLTGNNY